MTVRLDDASIAMGRAGGPDRRGGVASEPHWAVVREKGGGRSRPMLMLERTMYRDGFAPFTSVFTVRLRGCLNELRLRHALDQVQAKHPLLRCVVEEGREGPRFVERKQYAQVPLRIIEREDELQWERVARREWVTPFRSAEDPLIRLIWLQGNEAHEVMLVAHHCVCDGQSGMTLLRDLFAAYDDLHWDTRTYDALGGIDELLPAGIMRGRWFRLRVGWRTTLLKLALIAKALHKPGVRRRVCADQIYFLRWQFDVGDTRSLVDCCRDEHVTILCAVAVAMLQAFREIRGEDALNRAYAMVNARRFIPRLHPDALFGIAPGVALPMSGQSSSDGTRDAEFWECARTVRTQLTARIDRMGRRIFEYLAALEHLHDQCARLIDGTDTAPAVRHVTFSSVGRLELPQRFAGIEVEHVYSPLVMVAPSPANTVVISSFSGGMEFAFISDEETVPQADAAAIRDRTMEILQAAAEGGSRHRCSSDSRSSTKEGAAR